MLPLVLLLLPMLFPYCTEDDKPKSLAQVATSNVTTVTATTATVGGTITSNGNDNISAAGLAYSSTSQAPTITDDTTAMAIQDGTFTSTLKSLTSSTTYFVRAYATNSAGTAYGETVSFTTGNAAPEALNVKVAGDARISLTLNATYEYRDADGDGEEATTFQWYSADDLSGTNEVSIPGATEATYRLEATDEFKMIRVGITPKAASGTTIGNEVKSDFIGPIPEAETVTFMYNGESVTYGVIISSVTGKKWLDRNIGAKRMATSYDDYLAYGDLFQWGRAADGHQLMTWTSTSTGNPVNEQTTELSTSDTPDHKLFIINPLTAFPADWKITGNISLWQAPDYENNPCPAGWHIPTKAEIESELIESLPDAYDQLKFVASGWRRYDNSAISANSPPGRYAFYWTATISSPNYGDFFLFYPYTGPGNSSWKIEQRGDGMSCRCIQN